MSDLKKNEQQDWTHLLTDPELVGHIGKLLQAYREAAPDKREEALLAAMRQIRKQAAKPATGPAQTPTLSTASDPASPATPSIASPSIAAPSKEQAIGQAASSQSSAGPSSSGQSSASQSQPASTANTTATAVRSEVQTAGQSAGQTSVQPSAQPAVQSTVAATLESAEKPGFQPPFLPDLFTPSFGQDRRTYPRIRCFIAVELRCEGWETPVWGNLANVSAGGCFIETVEPIRKSTKLEVGLWANNGKVWVKGIVINGIVTENNPTFGLRLRYTDMNASERETLRFFLKFVEDTSKNYEKQNGYLAQLKR
jgi:PilZ domain